MNAVTLLLRTVLLGAVVVSQLAAAPVRTSAPRPPVPYDVNSYLHPQRLVDIGGRRLNILCTGTGSPAVILEAGLVADAAAWRLVQPAISRRTKVCSYDRAGLGFSDPAGAPRDAAAIVADLHTLLRRADIPPPYVLVGWSSGGVYTRLYQYRFPHEVTGLVEVDPDSEFETDDAAIVTAVMKRPLHWYHDQERAFYQQFDDCAADLARGTCAFFRGGLNAYRQRIRAAGCPKISPPTCALEEMRGLELSRPSLWKDEALELDASRRSAAELRAAHRPYGSLPLIVLTDSREDDIDGNGPITAAAQRATWAAKEKAEEHIAGLSAVGAHYVIAHSPHAIQLFHPTVVISAVDEVVDQARYNRPR